MDCIPRETGPDESIEPAVGSDPGARVAPVAAQTDSSTRKLIADLRAQPTPVKEGAWYEHEEFDKDLIHKAADRLEAVVKLVERGGVLVSVDELRKALVGSAG